MTTLRHASGSSGHLSEEGQVFEELGELDVLVGEIEESGAIRSLEGELLGRVAPGGILCDRSDNPVGRVDRQGVVYAGSEILGSVSGANLAHGAAALLLLPPPTHSRPPLPDFRLWGGGAVLLALSLLSRPYLALWGVAVLLDLVAAALLALAAARSIEEDSLLVLRPKMRFSRRGAFPTGIEKGHRSEHLPMAAYLPLCLLPGAAYLLWVFVARLMHSAEPSDTPTLYLLGMSTVLGGLLSALALEWTFDRVALARKREPGATWTIPRAFQPPLLLYPCGGGVAALALTFGLLGFGPPSVTRAAQAAKILPTPSPTPQPTPTPSPSPSPSPTPQPTPTPSATPTPVPNLRIEARPPSEDDRRKATPEPIRLRERDLERRQDREPTPAPTSTPGPAPTVADARDAKAVAERLYRTAEEGVSRKDASQALGYVAPGWKFVDDKGKVDRYDDSRRYFQQLFSAPSGNYTTSIRREIQEVESFTGDRMVLRLNVAVGKAGGETIRHVQRDTWRRVDGEWRCQREHRLD